MEDKITLEKEGKITLEELINALKETKIGTFQTSEGLKYFLKIVEMREMELFDKIDTNVIEKATLLNHNYNFPEEEIFGTELVDYLTNLCSGYDFLYFALNGGGTLARESTVISLLCSALKKKILTKIIQ